MNRREFVAHLGNAASIRLIGGAAAGFSPLWPPAARGQQGERMRRVGVLFNLAADDPLSAGRIATLAQGLQQAGWIVGQNLQIEYRWGAGRAELFRRYAEELVMLAPDAILAFGGPAVAALQQASRSVPIVFVNVTDPVGAGFVTSLARPGGNATGFTFFEFGMSTKWLELLKEIAPRVRRAAILRDSTSMPSISQFAAIQAVAPSLGVELNPIDTREPDQFELALVAFARQANGGLIVVTGSSAVFHRKLLVALSTRLRLPAVFPFRLYADDGGLLAYGPDASGQYRRAAGYVDRILKGEKPADLPVQAPTKYELVINLKTAKALGLDVPPTLLARADEVIE